MIVLYFAISILIVFGLKWLRKRTKTGKLLDKIPGPFVWPLLGNIPSVMLLSDDVLFKFIGDCFKSYGTIFKFYAGPLNTVHVSRPEDFEAIISSTKHLSKGLMRKFLEPWLGMGLLISEGPEWHKRRKLLTPAFHYGILRQFLKTFINETDNFTDYLEKRCHEPWIEVNHCTFEVTLNIIAETAMGTSLAKVDAIRKKYMESLDKLGNYLVYKAQHLWLLNDWIYRLTPYYWIEKKLIAVLHDFTRNVIGRRQETFRKKNIGIVDDDEQKYIVRKDLAMLDVLLNAMADGADIDEEGIREEVDTFMFEGHDTTAACLQMTLMLVACHPEIQVGTRNLLPMHLTNFSQNCKKFFYNSDRQPTHADLQNLPYLEMCIKESLRLYPSVPIISRVNAEEFTTGSGYVIPKDTLILIHIYHVHRNPKIYQEPEKFIPERFSPENVKNRHSYAFIPFSAGPRNCIGQKFAMMELKTLLSGILRKFRLKSVDKPENMKLKYGLTLKTVRDIRIQFVPRNCS